MYQPKHAREARHTRRGPKFVLLTGVLVGLMAAPALAQSGHFVGTPRCSDQGTIVVCTGKVAGLGGTTFEITVSATGIAEVECTNPGGNVAPGQDTTVTVGGTSGELPTTDNGRFLFTVQTDDPEPLPAVPTCPNAQWTPDIVDVTFGDATITLLEDGQPSDVITVPVS